MKIDVSTIALILLLVLPGLIAKKSRRKLAAQTFDQLGPTTELGELVLFSTYAHAFLFLILLLITALLSFAETGSACKYFQQIDHGVVQHWLILHVTATAALVLLYLFASLIVGFFIGVLSGWFSTTAPITQFLAKQPWLYRNIKRLSIFSVLEEKPISFDIFGGEAVRRKRSLVFFIEVRLRDDKGFITGEILNYAVVRDEEQHRLIVLKEAQFRLTSSDPYEPVRGERLLLDLADALTMQVFYKDYKDVEETARKMAE